MKKKILSIALSFCMIFSNIYAAGYPVFDVTGWLTAIDQLYTQYDMVMNTLTTIENQYLQIQMAIERAKSIDWENLSFDGDFDIRNDIRDVNKKINALLSQSRRIKETLTIQNIDCGNGNRYSIADLCGLGESGKNFYTAVIDTENFMTTNMKNTVINIENGLTQKQREAIWKKYGISPRNYIFTSQSISKLMDASSKVMAKATDEAILLKREEQIAKTNAIMQAAYSQLDSNGNMTDTASNEANLHLTQQIIDELVSIQESINDLANVTASKIIADQNKKQIEADEMRKEQIKQEAFDNRVPDSFIK